MSKSCFVLLGDLHGEVGLLLLDLSCKTGLLGVDRTAGELGLEEANDGLLVVDDMTDSRSAGVLLVEEDGGGTSIFPRDVEVCSPPASDGLP